jgi:thiamine-phosphate pyrophosphorylase
MASRGDSPAPGRPVPRLYLVTAPVADPAALGGALAAALADADVAAVLLRLEPADDRTLAKRVKAIAPAIQSRNVALLLDGLAHLAAHAGADGAHMAGVDAFLAAQTVLKPERIAGCGGLATRHDAMAAAEAGADYVMFGEPADDGARPSFGAIVERVEWWAEVFEVPCVGFAGSLDEVGPLAAAGADFVALGDFVFRDPRGPAATVTAAGRLLTREAVA